MAIYLILFISFLTTEKIFFYEIFVLKDFLKFFIIKNINSKTNLKQKK